MQVLLDKFKSLRVGDSDANSGKLSVGVDTAYALVRRRDGGGGGDDRSVGLGSPGGALLSGSRHTVNQEQAENTPQYLGQLGLSL